MAVGRVVQIIGPVIDCEFDKGDIPRINEAVKIVIDPTDNDIYYAIVDGPIGPSWDVHILWNWTE